MNFPVLFRTIDGASQATIETQYATELLRQSDWYGKCRRPRFSFFKKDINLWFVLTRCSPFGLRSARAPDDRRRTIVLYGWLIETLF
ncbi:hypothetical protein J2Z84_005070 [Agrobacterium rubi]|nr:hypothetical protein [Agrobacterium rubi]